jgi:formylglycine-generating enzyme required for sulfatase activity
MVMMFVPGGEFVMGSDGSELDGLLPLCPHCGEEWLAESFAREHPAHTVGLDGFWLDQTPVTNGQYAAFLNEMGNQVESGVTWLDVEDDYSLIEQEGEGFQPRQGYENHPVWEVSWYGAAAYCEWAGSRLPTEAEWEYAARGVEGSVFPWGDDAPTCDQAAFGECVEVGPVAVGLYPGGISWCDAQGMSGNVWEWVADWYTDYPSEGQLNPEGPDSGVTRVLRGGSWRSNPFALRGAFRYMYPPMVTYDFGFRCARDLE